MNRIEICPSILSADFLNLGRDLKELENAGVRILHFDVMDGHFVKNISFGSYVLENISENSNFLLDVHLMVERPLSFVEEFSKKGAYGLTFHIESLDDPNRCIEKIKEFNLECGLAISPETEIEKVFPFLDLIDLLLIMTVRPGFSGQRFMKDMLEKVRKVRCLNSDLKIEVDGGIDEKNIKKVFDVGADWFVVGSYIFRSKEILKSLEVLKLALYS